MKQIKDILISIVIALVIAWTIFYQAIWLISGEWGASALLQLILSAGVLYTIHGVINDNN